MEYTIFFINNHVQWGFNLLNVCKYIKNKSDNTQLKSYVSELKLCINTTLKLKIRYNGGKL